MAENRQYSLFLWSFTTLIFLGCASSQNTNCSEVKCPPIINCPSDSYVHEFQETQDSINNFTEIMPTIPENIFTECCINKKCTCKVICDVPACYNSSLVPLEIVPKSNIPGKCCPKYECRIQPNCTEIITTSGYWLMDCQRCECFAGQRICHRSCDEKLSPPPANCLSLNFTVFSNGDTWKEDECTHCECHNGEKKCQTSFCRAQNCAHKIKISGECCPICVTEIEQTEKLPIPLIPITTPESSEPCDSTEIHTEIVEVIIPNRQNCILYGVIVALTIVLIIFIGLYLHEKSKQRSYRPVSALDDNFNKITGKIQSKEFTFA